MSLPALLEMLYARRRFGIRPGIERIRTLLDRLGNPERSFRTIHVVGTNGKGSTAAFLSSILATSGHRTGRFTSPHLINFSERFQVNGEEPKDHRIALLLERVLKHAPEKATFFEIVTALAATLFSEEGVEIAVMEAGMGGRSDATAALPGILTVITPISLDHCEFLGATPERIAVEKVSIAEPGTPIICARQEQSVLDVIRSFSKSGDHRTLFSGVDFDAAWRAPGILDYYGLNGGFFRCRPGIPGSYQLKNAALAIAAAEKMNELGICVPNEALAIGVASSYWPGRMELIQGSPRLLLDGAHNPAGASALCEELNGFHYERLLLVTGVMSNKDVASMLPPLARRAAKCFCVAPAIERAMADTALADMLTGMGFEALASGSVAAGIDAARNEAGPNDLILVTGSLFTVGETKALLTGKIFMGIRG